MKQLVTEIIMIRNIIFTLFFFCLISFTPLSAQHKKNSFTHIVAKGTETKKNEKYLNVGNDVTAFLWIEQSLFKWLIKNNIAIPLAKARAEIATARAFNIEPSNWAKREIGLYVQTQKTWVKKRDDVEKRLKAAKEYSSKVEADMLHNGGNSIDPIRMGTLYWFTSPSDLDPNSPYAPLAKAFAKEHKIEHEREQLYHQFNKETPEEKAGGAIAILLSMFIMDAAFEETGLTAEAEATLRTLGEADAALAINETGLAMNSIMDARSIMIGAEEADAALIAVEEARTALTAGEIEMASTAITNAQNILSTQLKVNPALGLALTKTNEALAKLDSVEKADLEIGMNEKDKIDIFNYCLKHVSNEKQFLDADLKMAIDFKSQYKTLVAKGEIKPMKIENKLAQKELKSEIISNHIQATANPTMTAIISEKRKDDNLAPLKSVSRVPMPNQGIVTFNNETNLTFLVYNSFDKLVTVVNPYQRKKIILTSGNYHHVGGGKIKYFIVNEGKSFSLYFLSHRSH
jgi:hypothetical protein